MIRFSFLVIVFFQFLCCSVQQELYEVKQDSCVKIKLCENVFIRWSNDENMIVEDSLYLSAKHEFYNDALLREKLLERTTNKSKTLAKISCLNEFSKLYESKLSLGSLIIIFIFKLEDYKIYKVTGMELDSYSYKSNYPIGFCSFINHNSLEIKKSFETYYSVKKKESGVPPQE